MKALGDQTEPEAYLKNTLTRRRRKREKLMRRTPLILRLCFQQHSKVSQKAELLSCRFQKPNALQN